MLPGTQVPGGCTPEKKIDGVSFMAEKQDKSKFKKFLDENRSLVFTVPVFIVLLVVVILVYVLGGNNKDTSDNTAPGTNTPAPTAVPTGTAEPVSGEGQEVVTLPDEERDKDPGEISRNPFAEPYRVSGILYDGDGSIAIIEAENKSFIVEAGDEPGGYFKVISIEKDRVTLEVDGMEMILTVSGN